MVVQAVKPPLLFEQVSLPVPQVFADRLAPVADVVESFVDQSRQIVRLA